MDWCGTSEERFGPREPFDHGNSRWSGDIGVSLYAMKDTEELGDIREGEE
jgi:hypothetical protein